VRAGALLLAIVALVATGCNAAHKGPFAGISKYDAGNAAHDIIDQETADPSSDLYDKELAVADIKAGTFRTANHQAWVISMENFDSVRSPYCLYLWGKLTPFQATKVTYAVASCPGSDGA
jgi:hypothetical protein